MAGEEDKLFSTEAFEWARDKAGMSLEDAARKLKVSADQLKDWEDGMGEPSIAQVESMAEAYGVGLSYFYCGPPSEKEERTPDVPPGSSGGEAHPEESDPAEAAAGEAAPDGDAAVKEKVINWHWFNARRDAEDVQGWLSYYRREKGSASPMAGLDGLIDSIREAGLKHAPPVRAALPMVYRTLWCAGFVVMRKKEMGYRTGRKLGSTRRGFILPDAYAPVVFVNGNLRPVEQMRTIADALIALQKAPHEDAEPRRKQAEAVGDASSNGYRRAGEADFDCPVKHGGGPLWHFNPRRRSAYSEDMDVSEEEREFSLYPGGHFWRDLPYRFGGTGFLNALVKSTLEGGETHIGAFRMTGLGERRFDALATLLGHGLPAAKPM